MDEKDVLSKDMVWEGVLQHSSPGTALDASPAWPKPALLADFHLTKVLP